MWTVIKFDKKRFNLLIQDMKKKYGDDFIIYRPKIQIQKYKNNKLVTKEIDILGDYLFCFNKKFEKKLGTNNLKFTRGVKYLVNGFTEFQMEIKNFIQSCKEFENDKGYLSASFFDINLKTKYKFISGPFVDKIFNIISFQKNKIDILMGNLKTTINKKEYLFYPA